MNTDDPHLKCHLMSQIILHICPHHPHHHVVVFETPLSSIVSQRKRKKCAIIGEITHEHVSRVSGAQGVRAGKLLPNSIVQAACFCVFV